MRRVPVPSAAVVAGLAVVGGVIFGSATAQLQDRTALRMSVFARALAVFALASKLIDWTIAPAAIWLVGVALLAGGVLGAALRWPGLAWYAGAHPRWRAGGVVATLCGCALIIGAAVI